MTSVQFYFLFPSLFMLHELEEIVWMPSFVKKYQSSIQTIESYLITLLLLSTVIVLEQFLILMTSLYLSYQFNNYSIYASIIIAYIYHVLGHSDSDSRYSKICAWIVNGHFNEFVCSLQSQK